MVRIINQIKKEYQECKGSLKEPMLIEKTDKYRGQEYRYFEMDKKAFLLVSMKCRGTKSIMARDLIVEAFLQMEQTLLRQKNQEWIRERKQGKALRSVLTDKIKEFIEYAIAQGASENAGFYYANITTLQYKALGLIEKNEKINHRFRDMLNQMELHNLVTCEYYAKQAIEEGMDQKLHYKDIFQLAKEKAVALGSVLILPGSFVQIETKTPNKR